MTNATNNFWKPLQVVLDAYEAMTTEQLARYLRDYSQSQLTAIVDEVEAEADRIGVAAVKAIYAAANKTLLPYQRRYYDPDYVAPCYPEDRAI